MPSWAKPGLFVLFLELCCFSFLLFLALQVVNDLPFVSSSLFSWVGCEFGLKYSIDQSNNFVRVGNSKTGPALLRLYGICYIYTPN